MDPLKLLSRSTKLSKNANIRAQRNIPSTGQNTQPQLFPVRTESNRNRAAPSKKRKRDESGELDFFGKARAELPGGAKDVTAERSDLGGSDDEHEQGTVAEDLATATDVVLSADECKAILRKHKLKATWLNPPAQEKRQGRKDTAKAKREGQDTKKSKKVHLFPQPLKSFSQLRARNGISSKLAANIQDQGYDMPTEVQLAALPLLLDTPEQFLPSQSAPSIDLLTVAPTGSGKTLAFMIPLIQTCVQAKHDHEELRKKTLAIVLAPTKELAGQIVNEGRKLARETGVKITQVRKGMRLTSAQPKTSSTEDTPEQDTKTVVKSDILVSTPGVLAKALREAKEHDPSVLGNVRRIVLDEADVLLDPLFRDQTLEIWNSLSYPGLRVSMWSATMGSNIEEMARSTIIERQDSQEAAEAPLVRLVVGLKDSAVPNVQHKLVYAASEQGKLLALRQLLHPTTSSKDSGPALIPPFLVFTQTIKRAVALHSELLYDIPAEAGGIGRIAVLHSDLSDTARDSVMARFRKGEIWVLITTDLLSRGVDFRGVNGVVNYDIPTSSAAYVHRVGRTGRAGREGGVAVTLYSKEDTTYLKPIANLVATAHKLKSGADDEGTTGVHAWLLDALPSLSKKAKQDLKKRGVESRTAAGASEDPKAGRGAKISSKAGYLRREQNRRKGAILGSQKRQQAETADGDDTDFGGCD
ncbi:ATP-dependent RNA helicase rok1 [Lecanosticta acicola]|uniref:ATP-dependent RNA helicase n=1 Tax=Lecanosticta acicola TaxID=111012 RepID=A0AAI8W1V7_9PEZI|nr:ATP-dependent RNA helicase rok1 [Lecanosticta acicola]